MRKLYLFEIEADEKPVFNFGEWEHSEEFTKDPKLAKSPIVVAYGEIKDGRYIELYELKNVNS